MSAATIPVLVRGTWLAWRRDRVALAAFALLALLLLATAVFQFADARREAGHRAEHQAEADAAFEAQPDRHPHRMVHYGHYVFRTPAPLAVLDPGVDPYTGRSIFLEGHRRNTATFAQAREAGTLARFGSFSPAFVVQTLVPLVLILVGAGAVAGERTRGTALVMLAQGLAPGSLLLGKALALAGLAAVAVAPLALVGAVLVATGQEALGPVLLLVGGHGLYLLVWVGITVAVSALARTPASALAALLVCWALAVVLAPRIAAEVAASAVEVPPRSHQGIEVAQALRALGDSHDANDPNFASFRDRVLAQYGVTRVEDLPVNWRGLVAEQGEAEGAAVMNRFAAERQARERGQAAVLRAFAWASPLLAIRHLSMAAAGTDLAQHHRFVDAAEAHRFDLVQRLNRLHAEELTYADDAARSRDADAERRTRVSAAFWAAMPDFDFAVAPAAERVRAALPLAGVLGLWTLLAAVVLGAVRRRALLA
ncbi:MAG: DUF3526 domain-containing protein [Pseudomonadales bacterium]|jgi:ABC-2 type transport system permease protein|nr:DUF3526 domain-containing protein [Pseudomonadales bacterium]